ncbi:MAG: M20/M25/M40 family metallo-hydrolase [Acidobacteria bacterium]|nr:MAG: M20/M25/M40 family metallo-hydrolase [Acidobacteriota bacterium]
MIGRQDLTALTRRLVDVPSITGNEGAAADLLFKVLCEDGWVCERQPVTEGRFNVLAVRQSPQIILTTHIDTVPPFIPSSEDDEFVYGRASCDAKGIGAAMIVAANELVSEGRKDVGLLFVVGEETYSDGAIAAVRLTPPVRFVIDGEPTDNDLVTGHKGMVVARLEASGVAAHSGYPERGDSAIAKLVHVLNDLIHLQFPSDPLLGQASVNVGRIQGGVAFNVIPDSAEADIMVRTVAPSEYYVERLQGITANRCRLIVTKTTEPQKMLEVEGFPQKVVGYGTDIPALRGLGQPLLLGPGSIFDAHTPTEKIPKKALLQAVDLYKLLIRKLEAYAA